MMQINAMGGCTLALQDGRLLGFAEYGDPNGQAVIGFHGMPGSRLMMKALEQAALTSGTRIIAPERPGYGLSDPYPRGTMAAYPADIAALADGLGIDQFAVIGVSGGGPYALACAHRLAHRLTAAAVVSGIGPIALPNGMHAMMRTNRIMFTLGRFSPALVGLLLPRLVKISLLSMDKYVQRGTSPTPDLSPELFAIVAADQREAVRTGGKGVAFDMRAYWQPWGFQLEEIHAKVFLWHGEADDLAPVALARHIEARLPNCQAVFYPAEGHTDPLSKHADEIMQNVVNASGLVITHKCWMG